MSTTPTMAIGNDFGPSLALRQVKRALDFTGRSTRTEVLTYWVFAMLAELALSAVTLIVWGTASWDSPWLFTSMAIVFGIPEPALFVRPLHDQSRSGLWAIVGVPYALFSWFGAQQADRPPWVQMVLGVISILIIVFLVWTPTAGPNRFGPDPRLDADQGVFSPE